jgi:hypothetical protein
MSDSFLDPTTSLLGRWSPPLLAVRTGRPDEWFDPVVRGFWKWFTSEQIRELAANAALFLIVGGTAILVLIVSLVLLQSIFPERAQKKILTDAEKAERQLRPTLIRRHQEALPATAGPRGDVEDGRRGARSLPIRTVDAALDYALAKGLGEPRILRHQPHFTLLRFYNCRGCEIAELQPNDPVVRGQRCTYERGFLQGSFQNLYAKPVTVREVACHRLGNASCEYEVWH